MERKARFHFLLISLLLLFSSGNLYAERGLEGVVSGGAGKAPLRFGKYYALIIGNNSYKYMRHLKTARNDAETVERILREKYGFKTRLLLDADRDGILTGITAYRETLREEDNFLIYYAGHGIFEEIAQKAYWLPTDARKNNDTNWIIVDTITSKIKRIPSKHILIIADSCYSGTFTRAPSAHLGTSKHVRKMLIKASRTLMASGGNEPVSDIGGKGHSVFAQALIEGLNNEERRFFTAESLFYEHVKERVSGNADQTPDYSRIRNSGHDGGDFVFMVLNTFSGGGSGSSGSSVSWEPDDSIVFPPDEANSDLFENILKQSQKKKQAKKRWQSWQQRRDNDYQTSKKIDNDRDTSIKDKLSSWRQILSSLSRNNPYSRRDEEMRQYARNRIEYWENKEEATTYIPAASSETGKTWREPVTGMEFVWIPAGSFMMGSESGDSDEKPVHKVTLTKGFYMQTTEVTQAQWRSVMGADPPKLYFKNCGDDCPVERVSWDDVQKFLERLNEKSPDSDYKFSLPTEAQWEYAARAGSTTSYYFGDSASQLGDYAWYDSNSGGKTHPAAQKKPNAWGLYDMSGNVYEWCQDWHSSYNSSVTDGPEGPSGGTYKVLRGGSWIHFQDIARCASRYYSLYPNARYNFIGFRCARTLK